MIVSYCEGDVTIQTADTPQEFINEIRNIKAWNEKHGWRFIGIDPGFSEALAAKFCNLGLDDLLH
ncbi:MAG: hypothetical protein QNL11_04055 [Desulfobacterales bacterium]|jgi:hypothetical protein|nr:hypothetical protein [Desulfobacterales bacterium]